MIAQLTHVPRAAVAYFFVAPNQHIDQFDYSSLRQAKRNWPRALLRQAACTPLQPWSRSTYWEYHVPDSEYQKIHRVEPIRQPVLRYQGGDSIPMDQLGASFSFQAKTQTCGAKAIRKVGGATTSRITNVLAGRGTYSSLTASSPDLREDVLETRREERSWKGHR